MPRQWFKPKPVKVNCYKFFNRFGLLKPWGKIGIWVFMGKLIDTALKRLPV